MKELQENSLDDLAKCTVAIQESSGNRKILGTGVIVSDDGLIVTCYHVIGNLKNKTIDFKDVDIYFPSDPNAKGHADVLEKYSDPSSDIAFLHLQGKLPKQAVVANLSETIDDGHTFKSFGFRKEMIFDGLYSDGTIQGKVRKKFQKDNGILLQEVIQLKSDGIDHGMSGAAVLDTKLNKAIGIVSERLASTSNVDKNFALAIPVESIIEIYPELRDKNPGIKKFNNFLQAIGKSGSFVHERFQDVYVPPIEYKEIEKTLKEQSCIFITGTAEYGKTYTAIKLLWEFYKNGYKPRYIEEGSKEAPDIVIKLGQLHKELEHTIVYIEDPVGKTRYQPNKEFEESIGSIISGLGRLNSYLVVTMREDIYQKFNPIGKEDLKQYIKKLNIANHSYDSKRRKEILCRWATVMNCKWFQYDNLIKAVLDYLENDETRLPTPLNIKDFASETAKSSNMINKDRLLQIADRISQRTPERFARDIKEMKERGEIDKILLLCFPFISDWFSYDFIKTEYNKLVKDFSIKDEYAFERARTKLQDKVEFGGYIRFSHPSYSEALPFLLLEDGIPTEFNTQIFSYVLVNLAYNRNAAKDVAEAVASNFVKLPENARNLLFMFIESNETAPNVAQAVASNFVKLPDNTRNELLLKLADSENAAYYVANTISSNFDKLPDNIRNLLFEISKKDDPNEIRYLALAITSNYDELPNNIRNLLFEFTRNMNVTTAAPTIFAIISYYKKLPNNVKELVFELVKDNQLATAISYSILTNWKQLPNNVKELVFNLADDKATAPDVAVALREKLNSVPLDLENRLGAILRKYNVSYDRWWED